MTQPHPPMPEITPSGPQQMPLLTHQQQFSGQHQLPHFPAYPPPYRPPAGPPPKQRMSSGTKVLIGSLVGITACAVVVAVIGLAAVTRNAADSTSYSRSSVDGSGSSGSSGSVGSLDTSRTTTTTRSAAGAVGEGTHVVGVDIEPGTYRSAGATPGYFEFCSWSTRAGASSNSKVIDFGTANADEPIVVEIGANVKAFKSSGCEPWTKVG